MTSYRRRSVRVRQGTERRGTRGRKKLDFENMSKQHLPLFNKSIYMDLKNPKQTESMEEQLRKLGARIEKFLSGEVNYVISTSGPSKVDDPHIKVENSHSSPTFGDVPSPFNCGPSPTGPLESKKTMISRGKALAQIACSKNKASTVVANAEKLGIKVISVDVAHKWLDRELKKLEGDNENTARPKKENKAKKAKPPKKENGTKSKILKGCFVKFEASNQQYKPLKSEFDIWPKLNLSAPPGICPFGEAKLKVQHQYGPRKSAPVPTVKAACGNAELREQKPLTVEAGGKTGFNKSLPVVPELVGVPIITTGDVKRNFHQRFKKNNMNKQQGYCDCCEIKFKDIDQHVNGEEHRAFSRDKANYATLDAVIDKLPTTVKFLQSVLLRHCAQVQNDTPNDRLCSLENAISIAPPISPLSTEKAGCSPVDIVPLSFHTPHCEPDILLSRDPVTATDADNTSKKEVTPTQEENASDNRPQAVVKRRPVPSGIFTSPRRRQPTPSKKPWVQERSMIFKDSPIASLQPSECDSVMPAYNCSGLHSKNVTLLGLRSNSDLSEYCVDLKLKGEATEGRKCIRSLNIIQAKEKNSNVGSTGSLSCKGESDYKSLTPTGKQTSRTKRVMLNKYASKTKKCHWIKEMSSSKHRYSMTRRKKFNHKTGIQSSYKETKTLSKIECDGRFSKGLLNDQRSEATSAVKDLRKDNESEIYYGVACKHQAGCSGITRERNKDKLDADKITNPQKQSEENDVSLDQVVVPCIADLVKQRCRYPEQRRDVEKKTKGTFVGGKPASQNVKGKKKSASQNSCTNAENSSFVFKSDRNLSEANEEKERERVLNTENDFALDVVERMDSVHERISSPSCPSAATPVVTNRKGRTLQDMMFGACSDDFNQTDNNLFTCYRDQSSVNTEAKDKSMSLITDPCNIDLAQFGPIAKNRGGHQKHQDSQFQNCKKESPGSEIEKNISQQCERRDQDFDQYDKKEGINIDIESDKQLTVRLCKHINESVPRDETQELMNSPGCIEIKKTNAHFYLSGQDEENKERSSWRDSNVNNGEATQHLCLQNLVTEKNTVRGRRKSTGPEIKNNDQGDSPAVVIRRHDRRVFYPASGNYETKLRNQHDKCRKSMVEVTEKWDESQEPIGTTDVTPEDCNPHSVTSEKANLSSSLSVGQSSQPQLVHETSPSENIAYSVKHKSRFCKMFTHEGFYANNGEGTESIIDRLLEGSNTESLVIPNIADRVKSRSRKKCNFGHITESKIEEMEKALQRNKICESLKCENDINIRDISEMRQDTQDVSGAESSRPQSCVEVEKYQIKPCSEVIPNIAESVKRRRSCTMFNHKGQYASSGEGGGGLLLNPPMEIQYNEAITGERRHTNRSCRRSSSVAYDDQTRDESQYLETQQHGGESSKSKKTEGSPVKNDENSSDHSPAVVIRRRKPMTYPVFTGKMRPETDWGKLHTTTDWTISHHSSNESEADKESKITLSPQAATRNATDPASLAGNKGMRSFKNKGINQMLPKICLKKLKPALSRSEQSVNIATYDAIDTRVSDVGKHRKHRQGTDDDNSSVINDKLKNDVLASPSSISNSPRLKLKIRRNSNDSYSSTVEEFNDDLNSKITWHVGSIQGTPKRWSRDKNSTQRKKSKRQITSEINRTSGSESVNLLQSSPDTAASEKKREHGIPKLTGNVNMVNCLESSQETPKSKKRFDLRGLASGNEFSLESTDMKSEVDETENATLLGAFEEALSPPNSNRAQSPSFPSPIARKNLRSQTPTKVKNGLHNEASGSPVFKNSVDNSLNISVDEVQQVRMSDKFSTVMLKDAGLESTIMRSRGRKSVKSRNESNQREDNVCQESAKRKHRAYPSDLMSLPERKRIKLDNSWGVVQPLKSGEVPPETESYPWTTSGKSLSNVTFAQASELNLDDSEWVVNNKTYEGEDADVKGTIISNGISGNEEGINVGDNLSHEENEVDEFLNLVPMFSSPDKVTDSSWGDVCDSYLSTSVNKSELRSPHPLSSHNGRNWRNNPLSPFKLPEHFSSPSKRRTPQKSMVTNDCHVSRPSKHGTMEEIFPNIQGCKNYSLSASQQGLSTPVKKEPSRDLGFSPDIQQVDDEISFNFSSPQRLNGSPVRALQIGSPLTKLLYSPKQT